MYMYVLYQHVDSVKRYKSANQEDLSRYTKTTFALLISNG